MLHDDLHCVTTLFHCLNLVIIHHYINWKYNAPCIALKITEWMEFILDTHSIEYTWQAFDMLNALG